MNVIAVAGAKSRKKPRSRRPNGFHRSRIRPKTNATYIGMLASSQNVETCVAVACNWFFSRYDAGIANRIPSGLATDTSSVNNPKYKNIVQDYARTFDAQKQLPCDIFLTSHAGQFGLLRKWQPGDAYDPNRFVDPDGYARAVARSEARFLQQLQEERDEEKAWKDHLKFKDEIPRQF